MKIEKPRWCCSGLKTGRAEKIKTILAEE